MSDDKPINTSGCARDQRTTQYCAEAIDAIKRAEAAEAERDELLAELERLREQGERRKRCQGNIPPERVYLQWYGSADPREVMDSDRIDDDSVTWCWHPVFDADVEYVRPEAERDQLARAIEAERYDASVPHVTPDHLDQIDSDTKSLPADAEIRLLINEVRRGWAKLARVDERPKQ